MVMSPQSQPAFDETLLDLNTWEEPKEEMYGEVISARLKWSDEKYNAATEYRVALPRPIQQFELNIKRYDARYLLKDGTFADVTVYAGWDLEKFNRKTGVIERPKKTRSKEMLQQGAWAKLVGALVPNPERLIGMKVKLERFREKEIAPASTPGGQPFTAKNVVLPVEILPPTFVYTGEVRTIEVKREDSIENAAVVSAAAVNGQGTAFASVEDAAAKIAEFLRGKNESAASVTALNDPAFPTDARREPFISAFAMGPQAVVDTLAKAGVQVSIGADGFFA